MPHTCDACIVTCEDFRLHARADGENLIADYARGLGVDCDLITRAGSIQDLVRPQGGLDESLMRDIIISVRRHHVKAIHLISHEDCGAYADFDFATRDRERAQHHGDQRAARGILDRRFPEVEIILAFAELVPGNRDRFAIRPLD